MAEAPPRTPFDGPHELPADGASQGSARGAAAAGRAQRAMAPAPETGGAEAPAPALAGSSAHPGHASSAGARRRGAPQLSLKGRALKYLAAREHSRVELARKLSPHADSPEAVEALLDELEARGYLSQQRFIDSVIHRKAARLGMAGVRQALAGHGLDGEAVQDALASLSATEFDRAWALWQKKFGTAPADVQTRARQARFLMARGFGAGIVRQVLRRAADEAGADLPAEPDDGP